MKHNMKEYYSRRAPDYEKIYYRDDEVRRKEIDGVAESLKELVTEKDVLDIPAGTGYWMEIMSQKASSIVASDLSIEMLNETKKKRFNCQTDYVLANINQLPFAKNCFDIIAVGFWVSHHPLQDLPELFSNLKKLLRPNGKIWFIDNNPPPAEFHIEKLIGKDEQGNVYKKRFLDDGQEYTIIKNYFTEKEVKNLFSISFKIESLTYGKYYWSVVAG